MVVLFYFKNSKTFLALYCAAVFRFPHPCIVQPNELFRKTFLFIYLPPLSLANPFSYKLNYHIYETAILVNALHHHKYDNKRLKINLVLNFKFENSPVF